MVRPSISVVEAVQNSALGAVILWSFGRGYQEEVPDQYPLLHLYFLVLPIVLHRPTLDMVTGTFASSGLGKFIEKLERQREDLVAVHNRATSMRRLTLEAVSMGMSANLLSLDYSTTGLRSNDIKVRRPSDQIKPFTAGADKIGRWMARLPPANAFSLLRVRP